MKQNRLSNRRDTEEIKKEISKQVSDIIDWIMRHKCMKFMGVEKGLLPRVFALGRLFNALFLAMREEQWQQRNPRFAEKNLKSRIFKTIFGEVRYWRTYISGTSTYVDRPNKEGGYYPLDIELGLPLDGFSMMVRSFATKIATKMSYAQTVTVLSLFLGWSPCQKTVEEMTLGLGKYTQEYFESAPAPENDGEILVIQIDSKAAPMATDEELKSRRGKRESNEDEGSRRQRNRIKRENLGKKPKEKGDKSKNGKMATLVVMYTLRKRKKKRKGKRKSKYVTYLEGPINKWSYASFAPKQHAVAIARREADKRGFKTGNGKLVQIVSDGDNDLARYIKVYFPKAIHTIDIFHVSEYLWKAGKIFYEKNSNELSKWCNTQIVLLYKGKASKIVENLLAKLPELTSKTKEKDLTKIINYLEKRIENMNYADLRKQDLEIGSGTVEGAVKYIIAKRFDNGGMRWIKERAEMLLQLRCMEVNGDWDNFISFVHEKACTKTQETQTNIFLKSKEPPPLPTYGLAA